MKFLLYKLLYGLLWIIGHLPFRLLFLKSDFIFYIIYHFFPYRKKIVVQNLKIAFPLWSDDKINKTAKNFYRHFCDLWLESIAGGFKSAKIMGKRMHIINPELCDELFRKGKSVSLVSGHYGNWEWTNVIQIYQQHKILAIYKPLSNKYIDRMFKTFRERFGMETVAMEKILRVLIEYQNKNIPTMTLFVADQRPMWSQIQYWLDFLNQETPVVLGPEKISKKLDLAVVYFNIKKVNRGYYEAEYILLYEDIKNTAPYEITKRYYEVLEETIKEKPDYWLWTHNRWKHKKENLELLYKNRKK